jgi:hypothetical protein
VLLVCAVHGSTLPHDQTTQHRVHVLDPQPTCRVQQLGTAWHRHIALTGLRSDIGTVLWLFRATVDALARRLRGEGLAVAAYHAALPAAARADVLLQWRSSQLQVVVASVAFGMGVDKGGWWVGQRHAEAGFVHTTSYQKPFSWGECCHTYTWLLTRRVAMPTTKRAENLQGRVAFSSRCG